MRLSAIDWLVVGGMLAGLIGAGVWSRHQVRCVADYLVGGRVAGRYMLTVASGAAWVGAVNVVAMFELCHDAGFTAMWWAMLVTPFIVYLNVTGFGVYRFRQTRAMTVAQFLEQRYSRRVRVLAGVLAWLTGLINFGYFPAVGARFLMAFTGMPWRVEFAGSTWPTFPLVVAALLGVSLVFVFMGGHVAVTLTNCVQGLFMQVLAVVIATVMLAGVLHWGQVVGVLETLGRPAEGRSLLDPLHAWNQAGGFTVWFFVISIIGAWYSVLSNLSSQAYIASARTAHELRMSLVMNQWRWQALTLFFMLLVLGAMVLLHHPDHAAAAREVQTQLSAAVADQPTATAQRALRGQLVITLALTRVLPAGLTGLFCAIIVATVLSSHDNFMQTWGAVLLQDVVLPLRKRPFTTKTHIRLLRLSVVGVAAFALVFSCLFPNPDNLLMYFALTNNLWLGGAGAVILGGLYWKRGTTAAALTALGLGAILSTVGVLVTVAWPYYFGHAFPVDPQWIFFLTLIACSAAYVGVSLMGRPRSDAVPLGSPDPASAVRWTDRIFGITPEFTRRDRLIVRLIIGWYLLWLGVFLAGTVYGWIANPGEAAWARFWSIYVGVLYGLALVTTVWFTIAGAHDLLRYLRDLHRQDRDFSDTGAVAPGPSAEVIPLPDSR